MCIKVEERVFSEVDNFLGTGLYLVISMTITLLVVSHNSLELVSI